MHIAIPQRIEDRRQRHWLDTTGEVSLAEIAALTRACPRAEILVLPPLCPVGLSPYDFSASSALIERAAANTPAWLAAGGLERPGLPHELTPHEHAVI